MRESKEGMIKKFKDLVYEHFYVYEFQEFKDGVRFYVDVSDREGVEIFKEKLIEFIPHLNIEIGYKHGEIIIEAKFREEKNRNWVNLILLIATIGSTTFVGAGFTPDLNILEGLKFSLAIIFVLGSHEMGHYLSARMWGMKTSLPYFIPFPTIVGTLGAVIRHKGPIPNRLALFDVGVSGPLVGTVASVLITAVGLTLPYQPIQGGTYIELGTPLLFDAISLIVNPESEFLHPIAFAGWVGMLVTFFNLLPIGQLDGGHVLRAMIGEKADKVSKIMPALLIVGGWLFSFFTKKQSILIFWGIIALIFSMQQHPKPLNDKTPIGPKRFFVGILTFIIAILCFNPAPIIYS